MNQNKIMQSNVEVITVRPLRLIIVDIINVINNNKCYYGRNY